MLGFIGTAITIIYNSSQSVTAYGSFRFLQDYERLPLWLANY
jgi:hypothetical protein